MYESFYGLTEKPFTLLPDPEYLYLSPKHQRALTLLEYGMMNQAGFSVICGDTGAGKTTLIRRLLTELGEDTTVGLITNTHQSFGDLLNWVLMAFGIDGDGKSKAQMHQMFINFLIEQYAGNLHTVLIVDEAQNMNADTLEELRMLSNINSDKDQVLQVILAGQPALRDTLRQPELMQFAQRISVDYYLESLSKDETAHYIKHRLNVAGADQQIFTDEACVAIYRYSGGTPRLINLLCDTTLVYGFAEQTELIDVGLVDDVVREQHSNSIVPTFNKPLTDEDIEKLEKNEKIKHKPVVGSVAVSEQKKSVEATSASETIIAEMGKRARQAVSNYDEASVTGEAEVVVEGNKASKKITKKIADKKAGTSKITPIKQEVVTDESMEEILDVIDKQAEQKLSDQGIDSSQNVINEENEDEIKAKADELAVEEAIAHAEAEDELERLGIQKHQQSSARKVIKSSESEGKESEAEEANHKILNEEDLDKIETSASEPELEEKIFFEEVPHNEHRSTKTAKNKIEDVYPIIQVEENSRKGMKVLVLGFIGGLVLASIISIGGAYLLLGDKQDNNTEQAEATGTSSVSGEVAEKKTQLERIKLEAIQKERDAALAMTKALERERDAALATAKAQESMRDAERRAAEIIAEQERKSARDLKKATRRARQAELEAAKAKEREHKSKLKAMQAKLEADLQLKKAKEAKAKIQAEIVAPKPVVMPEVKKVVAKRPVKKSSKTSKFKANPCSSPSSKFLSTCKK